MSSVITNPLTPLPEGQRSALRPGVPRRVGVMVDCTFAYGREVMRGISMYGLKHGWQFRRQAVWMLEPSPPVPGRDVHGVLVTAFTPETTATLVALGVPFVDVSGRVRNVARPAVMPDDDAVGVMAVAHFVERGFTTVAVVARSGADWSENRRIAFVRESHRANLTCIEFNGPNTEPHIGFPPPSPELRQWLTGLPSGTAIFCVDDSLAESVIEGAQQAGLRVPEDLAVLGVANDLLIATMTTPALSSIDLNAVQVGYDGAQMLAALMDGKPPPTGPVLIKPLGVVVRPSTDLIAVKDVDIAAAVNFIRDRAATPITVSDVVAHVSLSRRPLEKRFRKVLGRSILQEIHRAHIERAKTLLVSTDLSVTQVAKATGFANSTQLGVTFRKNVGEAPSDFRQRHRVADTETSTPQKPSPTSPK